MNKEVEYIKNIELHYIESIKRSSYKKELEDHINLLSENRDISCRKYY